MSSLNKVMLIGRLGRDPEMRYFQSGDGVCNFSLATSETWNDKTTGNRMEKTEWHNVSLRGRVAEVAAQYLKKGSLVLIEGKIQSRKYTDKNGIERVAYEIVGHEMKMLGSKSDSGGAAYEPAAEHHAPPPTTQSPHQPAIPQDGIDSDIPF